MNPGPSAVDGRETAAAGRDPDVARLALESLKLVVKAELLYHDLTEHQQSLAAFLDHVGGVTGESR